MPSVYTRFVEGSLLLNISPSFRVDRRMFAGVGLTLLSVLTAVNAIDVITPTDALEVARGGNVRLSCKYVSTVLSRDGLNIQWFKHPDQPDSDLINVIMYFYGGIRKLGNNYMDRVNFTGDIDKNDCSIQISKLVMEDSGFYGVEVRNPLDLDGNRDGRIDVTVLVPPSKPICAIEGKAEYGQNVKLTCHSKEGSPKPTYSWQSFSGQNQLRQLPRLSSVESDGLSLKNLTADASGYFICTSRNKIQSAFCNITLAVMPPSMNLGFYGGIIGGVIAALILLGIIIYCCCCRGGKEPEDYEMEDPRYRKEYEEGDNEEEVPERDSGKRDYPGAYDDAARSDNGGKNSPHSTVSAIGTSQ
ncbi:LOW QUALITY PROTEIN: glycoprotein A33 (transmembrane), paralog a [Mustelus asterias]